MSPHPTTVPQELPLRPAVVRFTLEELVVRCPRCRAERRYRCSAERPSSRDYCLECLAPWRWS
ncbi:MAG: hypothetical protein ACREKK_00405 [Candidatus Methylomirabilales bacterium]